MKKLYTLLAFGALFFIAACGEETEQVEVTDIAGNNIAQAVQLTEGVYGDEINPTLAEYRAALAQTTTEVESYIEERIVFFITFESEDGIHYAVVDYYLTFDADEVNIEPGSDAFDITIYDNEEELNEAREPAVEGFNTFLETTQQLADSLEAQGDDIEFELDDLEGEFDGGQIQDFIEQAEAEDAESDLE